MSQAYDIDSSISHLEGKVELFKEAKQLALSIDEHGKVLVDNPEDSHQCEIWAEADDSTDDLISLSQLGSGSDKIVYDHENDVYKTHIVLRE